MPSDEQDELLLELDEQEDELLEQLLLLELHDELFELQEELLELHEDELDEQLLDEELELELLLSSSFSRNANVPVSKPPAMAG